MSDMLIPDEGPVSEPAQKSTEEKIQYILANMRLLKPSDAIPVCRVISNSGYQHLMKDCPQGLAIKIDDIPPAVIDNNYAMLVYKIDNRS